MQPQSIDQLFIQQAKKTPSAIALEWRGERWSFQDLDQQSDCIAAVLQQRGIGLDTRVALHLSRTPELVIGLLATLKTGAAYVPLDPELPAQRKTLILDTADCQLILSRSTAVLDRPNDAILHLDTLDITSVTTPLQPVENRTALDPLYVIFTSGSTGTPKGAQVFHQGQINLLNWYTREYRFATDNRTLLISAVGFDLTQKNIFAPLIAGGTLHLPDQELYDPVVLCQQIERDGITSLNCTPSAFYALVDTAEKAGFESLSSLEQVFLGGEAINPQRLIAWQQNTHCRCKVINSYGPTECSDVVAWHELGDLSQYMSQPIPIGKAIDNTTLLVVDDDLTPLPPGQAGELLIGGAGVGGGYLNRPEKTAQAFINHPQYPEGPLYRTGDRVLENPQGALEFIGRVDHQVKIRGFRIELGDIESALLRHTAVKAAVVNPIENHHGEQHLGAYLISENAQPLITSELRQFLQTYLPDYMLPTAWKQMDAFPLNPNGKVDRKSLPNITGSRPPLATPYVPPKGAMEADICQRWIDLLGLDRVGRDDRFFELGGTSIQSVRFLASFAESLGEKIPVAEFFADPTPAGLAAYIDNTQQESSAPLHPIDTENLNRDEPLAIIGMACRYPGAENIDAFWENLINDVESRYEVTREDLIANHLDPSLLEQEGYVPAAFPLEDSDCFDAAFFGIPPREAELMDPQHRLLLEVAWHTFEHAGYDVSAYKEPVGVFAGVARNSYQQYNLASNPALRKQAGEYQHLLGSDKDFPATRIAFKLGLTGPAMNIQTACSSSGVALHTARLSLLNNDCKMALVGGCRLMSPQKVGYQHVEGGTLSADGHIRAFDADASGMVRGNGVGFILVKRLSDAEQDGDTIHAVIRTTAISNDGSEKAGFTAPGIKGQTDTLLKALSQSGIDPRSISYVEAHGTGTQLGDPVEVTALNRAYRHFTKDTQFCALGSVKTNIGHLDAGACVAGIIKTVMSMQHGILPASLNHHQDNPHIDFAETPFFVNNRTRPWETEHHPRRAGVSAFGLGGTNAHVVLEAYTSPEAEVKATSTAARTVVLSARDKDDLIQQQKQLTSWLERHPETSLDALAYTLSCGRKAMEVRSSFSAHTTDDLCKQLAQSNARPIESAPIGHITFLFPGQGAQYVGMAQALYHQDADFKTDIDRCCDLIQPHLHDDLRHLLFATENNTRQAAEQLNQTAYTQPALFSVEYALAHWLMRRGIQPNAMIGHSIGEYVAACLSGVFSLEDAIYLVCERGRLMQSMPAGQMLAVKRAPEDLTAYINDQIELAVHNAPSLSVLAGEKATINALHVKLENDGIFSRILKTSHAFHSHAMEGALEDFKAAFNNVTLHTPNIPFIACATGTWITDQEATSPEYWAQQLRNPVLFSPAIQQCLANTSTLFLEVGPGDALTGAIRQHATAEHQPCVVNTLGPQRDQTDAALALHHTLGQLWCHGYHVPWPQYFPEETASIAVPGYPFKRTRHWIAPTVDITPNHDIAIEQPVITPALAPIHEETSVMPASTPQRYTQLANEIATQLSELSGIDIDDSAHSAGFLELGLDSLLLTQFSATLKKQYKVEIRFRELMETFNSVEALATHIDEILPPDVVEPAPTVEMPPENTAVNGPVVTQPTAASPMSAIPFSSPTATAGNVELNNIIQQQLTLMTQQLALLQGQPVATSPTVTTSELTADSTTTPTVSVASPEMVKQQPTATSKPFGAATKIQTQPQGALTKPQDDFLADFTKRYTARTRQSREYTTKHRARLADPRTVSGFTPVLKELTYPIVIKRSDGALMWDLDDNEYIDFTNGFGTNLLGHNPLFIREAIQQQTLLGLEIGPQTPLAGEVAELMQAMTGLERFAFCNTGSEAVLGAMRLARTITNKDKIVVFRDDYHGIFDEVIARPLPNHNAMPAAPGIPQESMQNMIVLEYGDEASLAYIEQHADEIAGVLIEPVQSRNLALQPVAFVQQCREITREHHIAFILDEIITGFRCAQGGAQAWFNVDADIATYGKIVGGGMPIGVIGGKAEYLDALDGGHWNFGDDSRPEVGVTYFAGTFVRHPLTMAAAKAMLNYLKRQGSELQEALNERTDACVQRLERLFQRHHVDIHIKHFSSAFRIYFGADTQHEGLFYALLRDQGIHIAEGRTWFLTTAHGTTEIDRLIEAINIALAQMIEIGFLPTQATAALDESTQLNRPDPRHPPLPGARLGVTPNNTSAWFIPDPDRPGQYLQVEH